MGEKKRRRSSIKYPLNSFCGGYILEASPTSRFGDWHAQEATGTLSSGQPGRRLHYSEDEAYLFIKNRLDEVGNNLVINHLIEDQGWAAWHYTFEKRLRMLARGISEETIRVYRRGRATLPSLTPSPGKSSEEPVEEIAPVEKIVDQEKTPTKIKVFPNSQLGGEGIVLRHIADIFLNLLGTRGERYSANFRRTARTR